MPDEVTTPTIVAEEPTSPAPPVEPSPEPAAPPAEAEPEPVAVQPEEEPPAPEPERLAKDVQRVLRELKAAKPEYAGVTRQLTDALYREQAYHEVFENVESARVAKAQLDAMGGADGIASMQAAMEDIERVDAMAARGDPALIDSLADEAPEGFVGLMRHGIDVLSRINPQAYAELLLPAIVNSGLDDSLGLILERLQNQEYDAATREVRRIAQWFGAQQQAYQGIQNRPAAAPAAERSDEAAQLRHRLVATNIENHMRPAITRAMSDFFRGRDEGTRQDIANEVIRKVDAALGADRMYQTNMRALMRAGKFEEATRFAIANIDAVLNKSVKAVQGRYAPVSRPAAPARPAAPTAPARPAAPRAGILDLPTKPSIDALDMEAPNADTMYIAGMGIRKSDGQVVRWTRPS